MSKFLIRNVQNRKSTQTVGVLDKITNDVIGSGQPCHYRKNPHYSATIHWTKEGLPSNNFSWFTSKTFVFLNDVHQEKNQTYFSLSKCLSVLFTLMFTACFLGVFFLIYFSCTYIFFIYQIALFNTYFIVYTFMLSFVKLFSFLFFFLMTYFELIC